MSVLSFSHRLLLCRLTNEWRNPNSDARFAWEWAQWDGEEQIRKSLGATRDRAELEQIARWILQSTPSLWDNQHRWIWHLSLILDSCNGLSNASESWLNLHPSLARWLPVLRAYFTPNRRADWFDNHRCVEDLWGELVVDEVEPELIEVEAKRLISHHQQLEAKLRLREWLRDKTTPAQITELLGA